VVIASSHALSALIGAGVVPDVTVAVDMEDLRHHFDAIAPRELPAVALGCTVHPEVLAMPWQRAVALVSGTPIESWWQRALGEQFALATGGSVAHSAFSLAVASRVPSRPSFRSQRFARSQRFTPHGLLRAYFIPLPRLRFTLQGFSQPASQSDSSPVCAFMPLALLVCE